MKLCLNLPRIAMGVAIASICLGIPGAVFAKHSPWGYKELTLERQELLFTQVVKVRNANDRIWIYGRGQGKRLMVTISTDTPAIRAVTSCEGAARLAKDTETTLEIRGEGSFTETEALGYFQLERIDRCSANLKATQGEAGDSG